MISIYEEPITVTKGKTSVTFAVAVPPWNPDESLAMGFTGIARKYEIYLKYENTWYKASKCDKYSSLKDLVKDFKQNIYSEEQFLEKIFKFITL